jgi:hypothetical protein
VGLPRGSPRADAGVASRNGHRGNLSPHSREALQICGRSCGAFAKALGYDDFANLLIRPPEPPKSGASRANSVAMLEGLACGAGMPTDQRRDSRAFELSDARAALRWRASLGGLIADMLRLSGLSRPWSSRTL